MMDVSDNAAARSSLLELVREQASRRLQELRRRIASLDFTSPDVDDVIGDLNGQIADYDPNDVPFSGFALSRDMSDENVQLLGDVRVKLDEASCALEAEGCLGEDERATLRRAHELLRTIEQYIRLQPFLMMKSLVDNISTMDVDPRSPGIEQAVAALESMDLFDRRENDHLSHLMTTTDPLGIFLRGFVLIEGSLNKCFQEFLARPLNLYKDLDLYVSGKIRLGHALGFLSDGESAFLSALNAERNKLVHETESSKRVPRHAFSVTEERRLWELFGAAESISGARIAYDESLFPNNLKTMLAATWLWLNGRGTHLQSLRMRPLDDALRRNKLERRFSVAIAFLIVKATPVIAAAVAASSSDEANDTERSPGE